MGSNETNLATIAFHSQAAWEQWLAENHDDSPGLWLKLAKKDSGIPSVTYDEAVEAALTYGWIDGQKDKFDDFYWLQRFSPRRPKSKWSKINREKAERLIAAGAMTPAGLREVERAQADGRWEAAYDSQRNIAIPDDLRIALEKDEKARLFFETLNSRNRYAILYRIQDAKRPETRARRIEQFVAMLSEGKVLYP